MFALFGLSVTMRGPVIKSTSNIVSLVSSVAVAVNAMNGVGGRNDLNSCRRENQTLKAACLLLLDFTLE